MPWSRTSANSLAIYGDEGEWIATCANAAIAGSMIDAHNLPGRDGKISTYSQSPVENLPTKPKHHRFDADVDALIDITDGCLARQTLKNDGWTTQL